MCAWGECAHEDVVVADALRMAPDVDRANRLLDLDAQSGGLPLPYPSCVPEFLGDTMLVNGLVFPTAHVEQRKYRLRMLNACNARFCTLRLFYAQGAEFPGNTEPNTRHAAGRTR